MKTYIKISAAIIFFFIGHLSAAQTDFAETENNAPVLQYVIPVQEVNENESFNIKINENTFAETDLDDQIVAYEASLHTGEDLPSWIEFDQKELRFNGMAESDQVGEYFIMLSAFDSHNAECITEIYLKVNNTNDGRIVHNPVLD